MIIVFKNKNFTLLNIFWAKQCFFPLLVFVTTLHGITLFNFNNLVTTEKLP